MTCEVKVEPLVEALAQRILTKTAIRLALLLMAELGLATAGTAFPPTAPVMAQAMVMVGISFLTFSVEAAPAGCAKASKDCHRGRFQAQGMDIYRNSGSPKTDTKSKSWALPLPPRLADGIAYIDALELMLLPTEFARRESYFLQMRNYIAAAAEVGGLCVPFPGKSYQSRDESSSDFKDRVRVDLEINAGRAFLK